MADQIDPSAIAKARSAGYSDTEIADYLAKSSPGVGKAREAGYSDKDIVAHLSGDAVGTPPKEAPSVISDLKLQAPTGFNEGLADTVGAPVDAMSWALRKAGLPIPTAPFGGSQSIKNGLGYINANPDNAPAQTPAGQIMRSVTSAVPATVLPEAGLATLARTGAVAPKLMAPAQALLGDGSNLARTAVTGAASGLGSEAAGQVAQGSPYETLARLAGGMAGGGIAGYTAGRMSAAPQAAPLSPQDVKAIGKAGYSAPDLKNLQLAPKSVQDLGNNIENSLVKNTLYPENLPDVYSHIKRMQTAGSSGLPVDFDYLNNTRQELRAISKQTQEGVPTRAAAAATQAVDHIDGYMRGPMAQNVVSGDPVAALAALKNADTNYGAGNRALKVDRTLQKALDGAATTGSGFNSENKIKQAFRPLLDNDAQKARGYSPEALAQLAGLVRGSLKSNAVRYVGNVAGGGGGLGATLTSALGSAVGGAAFGPLGAAAGIAAPTVGHLAKHIGNVASTNAARQLSQTLLNSSPVVQRLIAHNDAIRAANSAATRQQVSQAAARALAAGLTTNSGRLYVGRDPQ